MERLVSSEIPLSVFKFYSLKDYNIDAFIDHYLYVNHPSQLNDGMDACQDFLYMGEIKSANSYNQIVESIKQKRPQLVNYMLSFSTDKECEKLKESLYNSIFDYSGTISFSNSTNAVFNSAMWAYYTEEKGFAIEFKIKDLLNGIQEDFRNKQFELMSKQIDYKDDINSIDCNTLYSIEDIGKRITFQKQTYWNNEKEWRIYARSNQYLNRTYGRHLFYPQKAIKRIYLGNKFWKEVIQEKKNIRERRWLYIIKKEYMPFIRNLYEFRNILFMSSKCYQSTYYVEDEITQYFPTRSFNSIDLEDIGNNNTIQISFHSDGISNYREFVN